MILLSNGCSHTAGAEIEHPWQDNCYHKAWPKHLSKKLDFKSKNLAISGASTHRVVRTTLDFLTQYEGDVKQIFAVILWPGMLRKEIHLVSNKKPYRDLFFDNQWLPLVVGNDAQYEERFPKPLYNYYKYWTGMTTRHSHSIDYVHDVLLLQNTFKQLGINYLFWHASVTFPDRTLPITQMIDRNRFPYFDSYQESYLEICRKTGQKIARPSQESGFNSHFDEDAHKMFADLLFNYITKNKLL